MAVDLRRHEPCDGALLSEAGCDEFDGRVTRQDAYLALGESALTAARLFQGLVLSMVIILGPCYIDWLAYLQPPKCQPIAAENVSP